jgi:CRP/FNR family transcriptional regulator
LTTNNRVRIIPARRPGPINSAAAPKPGKIAQRRTLCSTCNLRELCAPCCGLTRPEMDVADRLICNLVRVRRGELLYRTGDRFAFLYAVRSGFFKSVAMLEDGRDQVTGFSMTGEVLGMDGIGLERHTCNTIALENSGVCAISFAALQRLAQAIPSIQRQFHRVMGLAIVREHRAMLLLDSMNAEERLAMFLLDLSQRFAVRGDSPSEFSLRMTREEIGSYLSLKLETVSRTFSRFEEEGMIGVRWKFIRILNHVQLNRVLGRKLD